MPIPQANILVDQTCHARLADFGLLTILSDSTTSNSYTQGGTIRWMSPELFDPEIQDHRRTIHSDCYALGMVVYEVLSQRIPFYQSPNLVILLKVTRGDRPGRPQGVEGTWFSDVVWELLERCWVSQPEDRPSVVDVLHRLEEISKSWIPLSPARLLAISSSANSSTEGSPNQNTEVSSPVSAVPSTFRTATSRSSEELDQGDPAGITSRVCRANPLFEF